MPEDAKPKDATEGVNAPEMPDPLALTPKDDIEGKTLLVESWKESPSRFTDQATGKPLPAYLVYTATIVGETEDDDIGKKVTFSGGSVMDDQARKMNEAFRATVRKAKGKRYWQFRKPGS